MHFVRYEIKFLWSGENTSCVKSLCFQLLTHITILKKAEILILNVYILLFFVLFISELIYDKKMLRALLVLFMLIVGLLLTVDACSTGE